MRVETYAKYPAFREWMEKKGLSVRALAYLMGIKPITLSIYLTDPNRDMPVKCMWWLYETYGLDVHKYFFKGKVAKPQRGGKDDKGEKRGCDFKEVYVEGRDRDLDGIV